MSMVTSIDGAGITIIALARIVAPAIFVAPIIRARIAIATFEDLNAFLAVEGSYVTIVRSTAIQRGMIAIPTIAVIIGAVIVIIAVHWLISAFSINAGIIGARISVIALLVIFALVQI